MGRHAYLIMAHNEPKALELLMKLLDDERNSLYLHIDARCPYGKRMVLRNLYAMIGFLPENFPTACIQRSWNI